MQDLIVSTSIRQYNIEKRAVTLFSCMSTIFGMRWKMRRTRRDRRIAAV